MLLRLSLLFLLMWVVPARADYLAELKQQARQRALATDPMWLNLLHYKRQPVTGAWRSLADDPAFFNAPQGNIDPQAELDATLAAFFSGIEESDKVQSPQCRFVARFRWLQQQLAFDPQRLPQLPCQRYEAWRAAMNPAGLTLVFPSAYLNSPASMYGHTMFRVDAAGQNDSNRLLAYTISYAAVGNSDEGFMFALKGLAGLYPGAFASMPYYLKVAEYNDIENRDVWEYELNLTQPEVERVLQHVWELGPIRFDYYFFDENCAYHLLSLLDVARPSLALTDRFVWYAIPSDTVRAVAETPGLLKRVSYRASNASRIEQRAARLSGQELQLAQQLAIGAALPDAAAPLPPEQRAEVLELADLYLTYLIPREGLTEAEALPRSRKLLLARSQAPAVAIPEVAAPAVRPDQGHFSGRVHVAMGSDDRRAIGELRLRPAYHDLLDPEPGFNRGAQLQFFDLALRQVEGRGLRLQSFTPVDIQSLVPRNSLLGGKSWRVQFGLNQYRGLLQQDEHMVAQVSGGPGLAWDWQSRCMSYAFVDTRLLAGHSLDQGYAAGMGGTVGSLLDVTPAWRVQLQGGSMRFFAGDVQTTSRIELNQRWQWQRNQSLRLEANWRSDAHGERVGILAGWSGYF